MFEEDVKSKLKRANFITVFCDGSTDSAVIEKEFIFCLLNHSIFQPTLSFIVFKDVPSQDTDGIKSTIMKAFDYIGMSELKDRMVILVSDDANINSGIKTGLGTKFRNDGIDWLMFAWRLPHQLELVNLFYLYHKSSKKLKELCKLQTVLKEMYEFDDNPAKS